MEVLLYLISYERCVRLYRDYVMTRWARGSPARHF